MLRPCLLCVLISMKLLCKCPVSKKHQWSCAEEKLSTYPELYRSNVLKPFTQLGRRESLHKTCESHAR